MYEMNISFLRPFVHRHMALCNNEPVLLRSIVAETVLLILRFSIVVVSPSTPLGDWLHPSMQHPLQDPPQDPPHLPNTTHTTHTKT